MFKSIHNYSRYEVSEEGQVRSLAGKLIAHNINSNGYVRVSLYSDADRKYKQCLLHRLVAYAFLEPVQDKPDVNHKDGNKRNNCVTNLEFCTRTENNIHMYQTGLRTKKLDTNAIKDIIATMSFKTRSTARELADKYSVSTDMIHKLWAGIYKHKS